jgi:CrcB protein
VTPFTWAAFLTAGGCGAVTRYAVDAWIGDRTEGVFPWGTLAVNVTGSLLLGFLTGLSLYHALAKAPLVVLGTGFCGAYTTFSTFTYETVQLVHGGAVDEALRNAVATLVVCGAAAATGLALASL